MVIETTIESEKVPQIVPRQNSQKMTTFAEDVELSNTPKSGGETPTHEHEALRDIEKVPSPPKWV